MILCNTRFWIVCGLLATILLLLAPNQVVAESITTVVPTPAPSVPPAINEPAQGVTSNEKAIYIRGSCQSTLIVKVFRNDIFAGSAFCGPDNKYDLSVDLVEGRNDFIVRQYDSLDQPSPDSDTVTVFYVIPQLVLPDTATPTPTSSVASFQLTIAYDFTSQVVFANRVFKLPIKFAGGSGPYAVSVVWGDSSDDLYSREQAGQFIVEHTYKDAGRRIVAVKVSDNAGAVSHMQFVVMVNGKVTGDVSTGLGNFINSVGLGSPSMVISTGLTVGVGGFALGVFANKLIWPIVRRLLMSVKLKRN